MRLNKDNVVNAICIFGIVVSICFMLIVMLKYFYGQKIDISFIKDIFSIGATLFAALIAISLFNDWKDQHNKQVNSEFIMKFYDDLFDMKAEAISLIGFLMDYTGLEFKEKIEQYKELEKNNIFLCKLKDFSMQKLSDLAFIINEDDYNKHFKNKIDELGRKLESILLIYNIFLETYDLDKREKSKDSRIIKEAENKLLDSLPTMQGDLYNHYRAFMVELKKYYRA
ncbi:hypothetical protein RGO85_001694 [Acinetobacter baumannii]|uniref:hypothetical protein n=2 Tax=Acinetobacter baumannii TaxID=470 RepID=UPI00030E5175|nr:hypothetical protein [Acinetobacter baumannii]AJB67614.1 hypothetical protein RU84_12265 [Acinetobacter baumannii]EKX9887815.1 hypothetical protein [Acinetobacter baumannii]ELA9136120.1 hypothetical protein [Acinetobacter baumannii]ELW9269476.1 hypothetical protein [Acinetobacter baumannii]MDB0302067.1 hypothetical protein [Acinetobacter baumannii]